MPKSSLNTDVLVQSDFKAIKKLIKQKYGLDFTLDYIRKVCKGKRNNSNIASMARKYLIVQKEMKQKIENLSN